MNTKWVLGHKISPQDVSGDYDMVLGETPAQTPGPPPHFHKGFHEVFLVTEGEMEFLIDGKPLVLKKGDSVNLPPNAVHTFSNNTNQPCHWVNIHSPKGFLKFFDTLGVDANEPDAPRQSGTQERIQEVMATAADYDMHIIL